MAVPEKLPQSLTQRIPRIIFTRTRFSAEAPHLKDSRRTSSPDMPLPEPDDFDKWGASLLGLYVWSGGSADPWDTVTRAICHFHNILSQDRFNLEALYYGSLAYTFYGLKIVPDAQSSRLRFFMEARNFLEKAKLKAGNNQLFSWCEHMVLKAQKTYLHAYDHTQLLKRILAEASSSPSSDEEKHDNSETTITGIEDFIKCMNEEARKELNSIEASYERCRDQECATSEDEVLDEEFEISDEVYRQYLIDTGRMKPFNKDGLDADTENTHMEVPRTASSEQTAFEVLSSAQNEQGSQQCNSSDAMGEFDNFLFVGKAAAETYNKDGRDAETEETYMEVHNPESSEQTAVKVSAGEQNEEGTQQCNSSDAMEELDNSLPGGKEAAETYSCGSDGDDYDSSLKEFIHVLRSQQLLFLSEKDWFEKCPNVDIQISCTDVHEPSTIELTMDDTSSTSSNDEGQISVDKILLELKDFIQFLIFEQFRRSAEATHTEGSLDADKLTLWGAALLGLSLKKSGPAATDILNFAISKLEEALARNSDQADALCYISNAYACLFWLTSDLSKSNWYFNMAKKYIQKAIEKDPDEALFLESMRVTSSLEDAKKKMMKSRKFGDAFGEEVEY